jgi:hypothetical protein
LFELDPQLQNYTKNPKIPCVICNLEVNFKTFLGILEPYSQQGYPNNPLKVLSNEKRSGLKEVSFDMSPFKLFTLRFSNKSEQAPSCERPETAPRTLFLLFANKNCIPILA